MYIYFEMCINTFKFVYTQKIKYMYKRTNIEIDVDLIKMAMEVTHIGTIKEVVHHSLKELIKLNKRRDILNLKGKVKWEGNLNEMRSHE